MLWRGFSITCVDVDERVLSHPWDIAPVWSSWLHCINQVPHDASWSRYPFWKLAYDHQKHTKATTGILSVLDIFCAADYCICSVKYQSFCIFAVFDIAISPCTAESAADSSKLNNIWPNQFKHLVVTMRGATSSHNSTRSKVWNVSFKNLAMFFQRFYFYLNSDILIRVICTIELSKIICR